MRIVLTGCFLLLCAQDVSAQVALKENKFGTGRFTDITPPPPSADVTGVARDLALPGALQVKDWQFDPAQKYQTSLRDSLGNKWYVAFQSSGEDFTSSPKSLQGWLTQTEAGCLRIITVKGSLLVGNKELKGKGVPGSFVPTTTPVSK